MHQTYILEGQPVTDSFRMILRFGIKSEAIEEYKNQTWVKSVHKKIQFSILVDQNIWFDALTVKLNWGSMYYLRNAIILQSHGLSSKHHNFLQYFLYFWKSVKENQGSKRESTIRWSDRVNMYKNVSKKTNQGVLKSEQPYVICLCESNHCFYSSFLAFT